MFSQVDSHLPPSIAAAYDQSGIRIVGAYHLVILIHHQHEGVRQLSQASALHVPSNVHMLSHLPIIAAKAPPASVIVRAVSDDSAVYSVMLPVSALACPATVASETARLASQHPVRAFHLSG